MLREEHKNDVKIKAFTLSMADNIIELNIKFISFTHLNTSKYIIQESIHLNRKKNFFYNYASQ